MTESEAHHEAPEGRLSAPHIIEYPYRRSVGPVLGAFFTALAERRFVGARLGDGRVLVPPAEYEPETGAPTGELVEVGPGGTVRSWAWVSSPRRSHPLEHPFAFALVRLDGADTDLLHAVDAGEASRMTTGMRVVPRWREAPEGGILDLACFEPQEGA